MSQPPSHQLGVMSTLANVPKGIIVPPPQQTVTPPPNGMSSQQPLGFNAPGSEEDEDNDDEQGPPEPEDPLSTINITVRTPLSIAGDNNVISVDSSSIASKVAAAIVDTMKLMSVAGAGVPMIDENGRPRPIVMVVEAETRVEGSKNSIGDRAVALCAHNSITAKVEGTVLRQHGSVKRERDVTEVAPGADGKKQRTE